MIERGQQFQGLLMKDAQDKVANQAIFKPKSQTKTVDNLVAKKIPIV